MGIIREEEGKRKSEGEKTEALLPGEDYQICFPNSNSYLTHY